MIIGELFIENILLHIDIHISVILMCEMFIIKIANRVLSCTVCTEQSIQSTDRGICFLLYLSYSYYNFHTARAQIIKNNHLHQSNLPNSFTARKKICRQRYFEE